VVGALHKRWQIEEFALSQNLVPWNRSYQDIKPSNEIFVVDDDEDMRELIASSLAFVKFPVVTFEDGDSFLMAASTRIPLCVFLDVVMPKRSGLEILQELRLRRYWTPIILTSARSDFETVVEAMRQGAHDYILKPFDRNMPTLRVRNAIEAWSTREQDRSVPTLQTDEDCEWFRLTPSERELVLLTRLMDT
jgi:FixJ family two-component response regulator